jgi:hypothetical protein
MPGYAGFDSYAFPGSAQMRWLRANTNLCWCGYYLGGAPSHPDRGWMGQRQALAASGWGIAPVFVGQEIAGPGSHRMSASQGAADALLACALMRQEGFADNSTLYLDLEDGPPLGAVRAGYVANWIDGVVQGGYAPGVYASHYLASAVHALRAEARVWAYAVATTEPHPVPGTNFPDPHPAGSGYAGAYAWQLAQNCRLSLPGAPLASMVVDLDTAVTADPSAAQATPAPLCSCAA